MLTKNHQIKPALLNFSIWPHSICPLFRFLVGLAPLIFLTAIFIFFPNVNLLAQDHLSPEELFSRAANENSLQTGFGQTKVDLLERNGRLQSWSVSNKALAIPGAVVAIILIVIFIRHYKSREAPIVKISKPTCSAATFNLEKIEGQAQSLAAQGLYNQAAHALLLQTIEEMSRKLNLSIPESLTSREIAQGFKLTLEAKERLSALVDLVEKSWFGHLIYGPEEYKLCFKAFLGLKSALQIRSTL
ncbi:MAG: hypothetical protein LBV23_00385 [Deltaproteobacteria bacterium]|nr:hypothetical protein [Deltaproteobacteria bacterium]